MRIEDEQTGGIIFLGIERLCPAPSYPIHVKRRRVARGSKRLATAKKTDAPSQKRRSGRKQNSAIRDSGWRRYAVFCRRVGQTPNPKSFQTSPAVSSRRDSERLGGAVEENQRNIQQPPGAQRCRCALFRRSVTLSLRNTLAVAQDSKKHTQHPHPSPPHSSPTLRSGQAEYERLDETQN